MKKKVWIMNHYATGMFFNEGGRHYWIAAELKKNGYEPVIFSCNVKHGTDGKNLYFDENVLWSRHVANNGVPFVVIKSCKYKGNGFSRIMNMLMFARNLVKTAKEYAKENGKPDVILASSVHPLTVLAGE